MRVCRFHSLVWPTSLSPQKKAGRVVNSPYDEIFMWPVCSRQPKVAAEWKEKDLKGFTTSSQKVRIDSYPLYLSTRVPIPPSDFLLNTSLLCLTSNALISTKCVLLTTLYNYFRQSFSTLRSVAFTLSKVILLLISVFMLSLWMCRGLCYDSTHLVMISSRKAFV